MIPWKNSSLSSGTDHSDAIRHKTALPDVTASSAWKESARPGNDDGWRSHIADRIHIFWCAEASWALPAFLGIDSNAGAFVVR